MDGVAMTKGNVDRIRQPNKMSIAQLESRLNL
jgi:hypothetical protein